MSPEAATEMLEIPDFFLQVKRATSLEEAQRFLKEQKERVRKAFRKKAKILHPDVDRDHEQMVMLNRAKEALLSARIEVQRPVAMSVFYATAYSSWYGMADATSTGAGPSATVTSMR